MKQAPCKGCKAKEPGCHSECDLYIEWKEYLEKIKENKRIFEENLYGGKHKYY